MSGVEWNPEGHDGHDEAPFWPGDGQRRRPRWLPLVVVLVVVTLVLSVLIWAFGGGDSEQASPADADTQQPDGDTTTVPGDGEDDDSTVTVTSSTTSTTSTSTTTTTPASVAATTTMLTTVPPEDRPEVGPPTLKESSKVSTVGLDTVQFGMTVAEAQEAAGTLLVPTASIGACYHVVPEEAPEGIVFMVLNGTIERVDVNSGPVTTRSGIGIGSSDADVVDLFGERIEREVRADGAVDLIFVPQDANDKAFRVVFRVTDGRVSALKAGRVSHIMADEPCKQEAPG